MESHVPDSSAGATRGGRQAAGCGARPEDRRGCMRLLSRPSPPASVADTCTTALADLNGGRRNLSPSPAGHLAPRGRRGPFPARARSRAWRGAGDRNGSDGAARAGTAGRGRLSSSAGDFARQHARHRLYPRLACPASSSLCCSRRGVVVPAENGCSRGSGSVDA